jgi:Ni,Fe-hydrogenase III small subunit
MNSCEGRMKAGHRDGGVMRAGVEAVEMVMMEVVLVVTMTMMRMMVTLLMDMVPNHPSVCVSHGLSAFAGGIVDRRALRDRGEGAASAGGHAAGVPPARHAAQGKRGIPLVCIHHQVQVYTSSSRLICSKYTAYTSRHQ